MNSSPHLRKGQVNSKYGVGKKQGFKGSMELAPSSGYSTVLYSIGNLRACETRNRRASDGQRTNDGSIDSRMMRPGMCDNGPERKVEEWKGWGTRRKGKPRRGTRSSYPHPSIASLGGLQSQFHFDGKTANIPMPVTSAGQK